MPGDKYKILNIIFLKFIQFLYVLQWDAYTYKTQN